MASGFFLKTSFQANFDAHQLGLLGVTFLYSSGDNGVAGNSGLCLNPDGSQGFGAPLFNPSFPGTCPFITSVVRFF